MTTSRAVAHCYCDGVLGQNGHGGGTAEFDWADVELAFRSAAEDLCDHAIAPRTTDMQPTKTTHHAAIRSM